MARRGVAKRPAGLCRLHPGESFRVRPVWVRRVHAAGREAASDDFVGGEISQLTRQVGAPELLRRVGDFVETITRSGFDVPCGALFSPALADRLRDVFKVGALRGLQWTGEAAEIPTIEILREQASRAFPKQAVLKSKDVLSLFSGVITADPMSFTFTTLSPTMSPWWTMISRRWRR